MRVRSVCCKPVTVAFVLLALAGAAGLLLAAPNDRPAQAFPERVIAGLSPEENVAQQRILNAGLLRELPGAVFASPAVHMRLTPEEARSLERALPSGPGPLRVGVVRPLAPALEIGGLTARDITRGGRALAGGVLRATDDGGFIWAASLVSEDAAGVRVHFTRFDLPAGAEAYILSRNGEAHGPYQRRGPDGSGAFWSNSVRSPEAAVVVRFRGAPSAEALRGLSLVIGEVGHVGPRFQPQLGIAPQAAFCGLVNCVVDVSCIDESVPSLTNAVAEMEWIQGAFIYTCTGGLISDNDTSTNFDYFLTANHCVSSNKTAANIEAFFFYRTSSCGGTCPNNSTLPRVLGASVAATGRDGDFTLLRLSQAPPSGSVKLGWTTAAVASSNGTHIFRVSNPDFGPQVWTEQVVDTSAGTCSGLPRGAFIYSRDIVGATDGGSSGSPVTNGSAQIVGQLYGSCGTNVSDPCDPESNATVDGAFASYFPNVSAFLDPSGGPVCSPSGAICTANSECCSNSCKGPSGRKTCR